MEENQFGIFLLSPLAAVTLAISIYSSHECTLYTGSPIDLSPGARIRKFFFGCLAVAAIVRFLSIIFELVYLDDDSCSNSLVYCLLIRYIADILYISVYSVLILHWAALLFTTSRSPFAVMRFCLIVGNICLLISILCIFMFSKPDSLATNLWIGLGISYLLLLSCLVAFGIAITRNVPVSLVLGRHILHRVITLGSISATSLSTAVIYYFAIAFAIWNSRLGFPRGLILPFDFCKILILETAPSVAIILLTLRRRISTPSESTTLQLGMNFQGYSSASLRAARNTSQRERDPMKSNTSSPTQYHSLPSSQGPSPDKSTSVAMLGRPINYQLHTSPVDDMKPMSTALEAYSPYESRLHSVRPGNMNGPNAVLPLL